MPRRTGWWSRPAPSPSCSSRCSPCASRAMRCCTRTPASPCTSPSPPSWGPSPCPSRSGRQRVPVDPEEVERLITPRTKLLILNSPHNPCGSALTAGDCEALAELAVRHDLTVLSDEVYWACPLRQQARQRPRFRWHGRAHRPTGRLVQAICHDGLAAGLRRVPAGAGRAGDPPDHQLCLLHLGVQPGRGGGRPRRALEADRGHGGGVPLPARRHRRRPGGIPGITCASPAGRSTCSRT